MTDTPMFAEPEQERDEGQESLAEALRLSFVLLRWVMILLLGYFGFSGLYTVEVGTVVVHSRFGGIVGEVGRQVRAPGGPYFAFPAPIDQRVVVSTRDQTLKIRKVFWFEVAPEDEHKSLDQLRIPEGGLEPGKDGALLTGDKNIVHGQWTVTYRVEANDAVRFIQTFSVEPNGEYHEQTKRAIRFACEQGICRIVASTTAEAYLSASFDRQAARRAIQEALDRMAIGDGGDCGITIKEVLLEKPTPPLRVRASFTEVAQAESEKAQEIERADRERSRTLNEVAGAGYKKLLDALDRYDLEQAKGKVSEALENELAGLLSGTEVGGKVSQRIRLAQTYSTTIVETVRTEAEYFKRLLPQYIDNPRIVWDFLWQETLWEIYGYKAEKFYVPAGAKQIYIELSRDPKIALKDAQDEFVKEIDKAREKADK